MSVVFDKLSFVKRLEDAGTFSRPQAETLSDAFHVALSETVATKADLDSGLSAVRSEMGQIRVELRHEIGEVRKDLTHEISEVRKDMAHGFSEARKDLTHEIALVRSEAKAGLLENRVWTVGVGASIVAVLAAMKYFG